MLCSMCSKLQEQRQFLFSLKQSENCRFSDDYNGIEVDVVLVPLLLT